MASSHTKRELPYTMRILAGIRSALLYAINDNCGGLYVNNTQLNTIFDQVTDLMEDWNSRHVDIPELTLAGIPAVAHRSDEGR